MTWRAILGAGAMPAPAAHNAHNPHNPLPKRHYEHSEDYEEQESKLLAALSTIIAGLPITPANVLTALAPEDVADWAAGLLPADTLATFTRCLLEERQREAGQRPDRYTMASICRQCGPVWTWWRTLPTAELASCIWCHNRRRGLPIPRPALVRCGDCRHFQPSPHHLHLGRCALGEPAAVAGNWDGDKRLCTQWLPQEVTP